MDLGSWFRCSVDGLAQQAGLGLGLFSPEEVALDSEVSRAELVRRFSNEARALKDASSGDGGTWFCGPPEGMAGPSRKHIDATLQLWAKRLAMDSQAGVAAWQALLESMAVDIALAALARCKPGREVLQGGARDLEGGKPSEPLGLILARASAAPAQAMGARLRLLSSSAEVLGRHELGALIGADPKEVETILQWCATLVSYAVRDAAEARLLEQGQPVEAFEAAQAALAQESPIGFDQQLDATESLDRCFQKLRKVCEMMATPGRTAPKVSDAAETRLKANIACLSTLRVQEEARPASSDELSELRRLAAPACRELESELCQRQERVAKLIRAIGDFPDRRKEVMATCLECERVRRRRFEEFQGAMQKLLWGEDSHYEIARDPAQVPVIRDVLKRAGGLVDQAWRDMVGLAAEALDDDNAIGAKSEDMSSAASQYKSMRQDLAKNLSRLSKLEEEAASGPPPPPKPKLKAAPAAKMSGATAAAPHPKTTVSAAAALSPTTTASPPGVAPPAQGAPPAAPLPPTSPLAHKPEGQPAGEPAATAPPAAAKATPAATASTASAAIAQTTCATEAPQDAGATAAAVSAPQPRWSQRPSVGTWLMVRLKPPEETLEQFESVSKVQQLDVAKKELPELLEAANNMQQFDPEAEEFPEPLKTAVALQLHHALPKSCPPSYWSALHAQFHGRAEANSTAAA